MKNALSIGLALLLLTSTAYAEDNDKDHEKLFWSLAAGSQAATAFDVYTTRRALNRCVTCYEANPVMQPFMQNNPAAYTASLGLSAASIYGSKVLKERKSRWWWVPMVSQIGIHTALGIRNSRLR